MLAGLAMTQHRRSLLMRREYTDLGSLTERCIMLNKTRDGFNGSLPPKLLTPDERRIDFGACKDLGDEQTWQGNPHDLIGFDEAVQFLRPQVDFVLGWNRSTIVGQRRRAILATNPPVDAAGQWIVNMFRPWLDLTYPNPAKPGELRWVARAPDGTLVEVADGTPVQFPGEKRPVLPRSYTFLPSALGDNMWLTLDDGYQSVLDNMPEPYRSAMRDGNFMAARGDAPRQLIPTKWVLAAQQRWTPQPPQDVPMCAMGVDVAAGGDDETVIAARYDSWYAPLVVTAGRSTPLGSDTAALVVKHRRGQPIIIIDMGGGYGGAPFEHLKSNGLTVVGFKGAAATRERSVDRLFNFANTRAAAWWKFREALDPSQPGGSQVALPPDPVLLADLTAPTFEITKHISIESKEDIVKRLGRSTDRGDAVVMAWYTGDKILNHRGGVFSGGYTTAGEMCSADRTPGGHRPRLITGRSSVRSLVHGRR